MKKLHLNTICIFVLCIFAVSSPVFAQDEKVIPPTVDAHGAILMDAETGRILWGKDEHKPLAMASTTKIMTAILALESGRMDETVTVSAKAASAPRMKMFLTQNEKLRLGDLMLALMLESSNDAAVAIAEHLSGSVEAFCQEMTEKAYMLGAQNTVFETASGLDAGHDKHQSTPYDLAVITRYALNVPGFIELTNTRTASFSSNKRSYNFNNKNRLLNEFEGANGVKTGFTNKAGHCFVGAAKRDGMQLISVVLASGWGDKGRNQKWVDTKEILNFGFGNFEYKTVITAKDPAGTMPVTRSRTTSVDFIFDSGMRVLVNKDEDIDVELFYPISIQAPVNEGDLIGSARVYIESEFYREVMLVSTGSATRHDFKTSLEKVINAYFGLITRETVNIILPELGS